MIQQQIFFLFCISLLFFAQPVFASWMFKTESGIVTSGYNDVQIPGDTGTKFSLSEELKIDQQSFFRAEIFNKISDRSYIRFLYAPLSLNSKGKLNNDVLFNGDNFSANTEVNGNFRFDSYRISYIYEAYRKNNIALFIGATGKIRDAEIKLESNTVKSSKKNTGFVPLINFGFEWQQLKRLKFIFEGDALAAPQGRAEDIFIGWNFEYNKNLDLLIGYRILEGGADNKEVYNFSLLNYMTLGVSLKI